MPRHWIDYVILSVIGLSVITGLFRGFLKELIALCVWILAIGLAFTYSRNLNPWLQTYIKSETAQTTVGFITILLSVLIAGGLLNAFLSFILNRSGLSFTDRFLGMGFGFVRGVFIVSLMMLVLQMTSIPYKTYSEQSFFYAKFEPIVNWLYNFMPDFIKQVKVLDTIEDSTDSFRDEV